MTQISILQNTMRKYRLRKKELYQGKRVTKPCKDSEDVTSAKVVMTAHTQIMYQRFY